MALTLSRFLLLLLLLPVCAAAQRDSLTPWVMFLVEAGVTGNSGKPLPPPLPVSSGHAMSTRTNYADVHEQAGAGYRFGVMSYPLCFRSVSFGAGLALAALQFRGVAGEVRTITAHAATATSDTTYLRDVTYRYIETTLQLPVVVRYRFLARPRGFFHAEAGGQINYMLKVHHRDAQAEFTQPEQYRGRAGVSLAGGIGYTWSRCVAQPTFGIVAQHLAGQTLNGRQPWFVGLRVGISG